MHPAGFSSLLATLFAGVFFLSGCLSAAPSPVPPASSNPGGTLIAIQATQVADSATKVAAAVWTATSIALLPPASYRPPAGAPEAVPTAAVATPEPILTLPPDPIQPSPTPAATPSSEDIDLQIQAAKILLYENMSGRGELRYVLQALDDAGYTQTDVGSAKGWFKTNLLSGEQWDLIIAASEHRSALEGEYFAYLLEHLDRGSSAILEVWDLDDIAGGEIAPLLDRCGIQVEKDWFEPPLRFFWWLAPEDPIFHYPNEIGPALRHYRNYWQGDVGDLLSLSREATGAQLLAGTLPQESDQHGTLATCFDGRLILQTFSSHEYRYPDILYLWQNYVYHALYQRFAGRLPAPGGEPEAGRAVFVPPETQVRPELLPSATVLDIATLSAGAHPGQAVPCGDLALTSPEPSQLTGVLFEYHSAGTYLVTPLKVENFGLEPVRLWAGDYYLTGQVNGKPVVYTPDKAPTGYLYNAYAIDWRQEAVTPGESWETMLAFDVNPRGEAWTLVVAPGVSVGAPYCQAALPLAAAP